MLSLTLPLVGSQRRALSGRGLHTPAAALWLAGLLLAAAAGSALAKDLKKFPVQVGKDDLTELSLNNLTYLDLGLRSEPDSTDSSTALNINRTSPEHQAGLRAGWQLAQDWNLSGFLRYVSELNPSNGNVPAYTDLNLRAAWGPWKSFELAVVGENLFDPQHSEFRTPVSYTEVERSGIVELNWAWD